MCLDFSRERHERQNAVAIISIGRRSFGIDTRADDAMSGKHYNIIIIIIIAPGFTPCYSNYRSLPGNVKRRLKRNYDIK